MNKEFILAIEELEKEREISKDLLIEAIEMALLSAYKKNYGTAQNVRVNIDRESGDIDVYMRKDVVSEVEDELAQVSIDDVLELDPNYQVGDAIEYRVTPRDFGRIAAQTAKQVVVQRIREAERGMIFDDYVNRQGEIITGTIQRISNETVFVSIGRTEGILSVTEQVRGETYNVNSRMKFFIMDVRKSMKGPQIYLSRSHPGLVKRLFELEVPEIQDGAVEIKSLAREAGSRTKIAVFAVEDGIDPVGACVGARGTRVQAVVDELFGEKIDIINWSDEPQHNISSALSPSKVERVIVNSDGKSATAVVPDYQLSLAIGKEGQNVRLAAKLCGWKIDIKSHTQFFPDEVKGDDIEFVDVDGDGFVSLDDIADELAVDENELVDAVDENENVELDDAEDEIEIAEADEVDENEIAEADETAAEDGEIIEID
ncbi:MAG: transcription termination factor NusA [Clostridiales Family XIII bacterium]|jgi:N utilization substance protein A|nr:transcription termination factor NusA [Clostridiales Family XIII bacterium]